MFGKQSDQSLNGRKYNTLIHDQLRLVGDIKLSGSIYFDGQLKGNMTSNSAKAKDALLVIGPNAIIVGNITSKEVYVMGKVEGKIYSDGTVHLMSGSMIKGDVHYADIVMSHGARVDGKFNHIETSAQTQSTMQKKEPTSSESSAKLNETNGKVSALA